MTERDDDYDYLMSLGYDTDIENLISIHMEEEDELYDYLPCAYYSVGFGLELNKPIFVKCGISQSYIRRLKDYHRWAKKNNLVCWVIGEWIFDDYHDALLFEKVSLSRRKGKLKLGNFNGKINKKKLEKVIDSFPHKSELFNFNHKVSFKSSDFPVMPRSWDEYWDECDLPMDHSVWEKFVGKWEEVE